MKNFIKKVEAHATAVVSLLIELPGRIRQGAQAFLVSAARKSGEVLASAKKFVVYILVDKVTGKVYIGCTGNVASRVSYSGYKNQGNIKYALKGVKSLFERFLFVAVDSFDTAKEGWRLEAELIKLFGATNEEYGYNVWNRAGQLQSTETENADAEYKTSDYIIAPRKRAFTAKVNGVRYRFSSMKQCHNLTGDDFEHIRRCVKNSQKRAIQPAESITLSK